MGQMLVTAKKRSDRLQKQIDYVRNEHEPIKEAVIQATHDVA